MNTAAYSPAVREFFDSTAKNPAAESFFETMSRLRSSAPISLELPPPSFVANKADILIFEPGKTMTVAFPVQAGQLNPMGYLQGGVLGSFIDDVFGSLTFASFGKATLSLDLNVNFIRGVRVGQTVKVRADVKSRGMRALSLYAEAFNEREKLIATSTSNVLFVK